MVTINAFEDLGVTNGYLTLVRGKELVRQAVFHRLRFHFGEWFRAPDDGILYFQLLVGQPYDEGLLRSYLLSEILKVDGVIRANVVSLVRNANTRDSILTVNIETADGPTNLAFALGA